MMYAQIKLPNKAPMVIMMACSPMVWILLIMVSFIPTRIPNKKSNTNNARSHNG